MEINTTLNATDPRINLIAAAHHFYNWGWMVGTAGNLSARLPDGSFWITASGRNKGELATSDFVRIYPDGKVEQSFAQLKPSAETAIHQSIYALFPQAQACYHVHSIDANLVANFADNDNLALPSLEMIKGLGLWSENPTCQIPLFHNHLQVSRIAAEIKERFRSAPPQIPALLIRNHGVTVWASSTTEARNYIELVEYVFRYMVAVRQMK